MTGYIIEKRLSTTHNWEKAATVDPSITLHTIENLKEKCQYFFRVSAENEVGAGEPAATDLVALRTSARKYKVYVQNEDTTIFTFFLKQPLLKNCQSTQHLRAYCVRSHVTNEAL